MMEGWGGDTDDWYDTRIDFIRGRKADGVWFDEYVDFGKPARCDTPLIDVEKPIELVCGYRGISLNHVERELSFDGGWFTKFRVEIDTEPDEWPHTLLTLAKRRLTLEWTYTHGYRTTTIATDEYGIVPGEEDLGPVIRNYEREPEPPNPYADRALF